MKKYESNKEFFCLTEITYRVYLGYLIVTETACCEQ